MSTPSDAGAARQPGQPGQPGHSPPGLGPHCVGTRVVLRRVVGGTGPSGGPAMTDLLGVMLAWGPESTTLQPEDGPPVEVPLSAIVSGKPVPPRPSVLARVGAEEAERRAVGGWPPVESRPLGAWVLRAAGGYSARANSVLAVGDPGLPVDEALAEVTAFYAARGLPAWAQVVVDSPEHEALEAAGWVRARPGEDDTRFEVASLASVARALRTTAAGAGAPAARAADVRVVPRVSEGWLAHDPRAVAAGDAARTVLEGPAEVGFAEATGSDGAVVATGRVSHHDDWAGITDVWVSPAHRRQGLGLAVLDALVGWAGERGARVLYLQVRGDNPVALALYARLGFRTHHAYRYLTAP